MAWGRGKDRFHLITSRELQSGPQGHYLLNHPDARRQPDTRKGRPKGGPHGSVLSTVKNGGPTCPILRTFRWEVSI